MAAVQASIPFRSRKKTSINGKRSSIKANDENVDHMNLTDNKLKRRKEKAEIDFEEKSDNDESCSPNKISRIIKDSSNKKDLNKETLTKESSDVILKPLPSRETEIEWLEKFLVEHLETQESASVYVSGQPGTGKTACLSYILQLPKIKEDYIQVYINCTMMKSASSIYKRICNELKLRTTGSTEKACLKAIEKYLSKNHKMILLVLDEIDQLESSRQSVLYTVFEWSGRGSTRLVLVGISNALDLTERALPRLQARSYLRPHTLHFAPYTKQQIVNIFTAVMAQADDTSVFSPVALQMLAAKISAISGDMRRALDIGRRVVELAKRTKFSETHSVESLLGDSSVTVELRQVLQVLSEVYGGSGNIEAHVDDDFPMHQKLILCSLILLLTREKNKHLAVGKLYDLYKKVAAARNIAALDMSEVVGACSLLETRGALRVTGEGGGRGARGRRLRLLWDETELAASLRDKPLLAAILEDKQCLA